MNNPNEFVSHSFRYDCKEDIPLESYQKLKTQCQYHFSLLSYVESFA